jgi:DNA-binding NtrC family response regulator
MNHPNDVTRVLLIADDPDSGVIYRDALAAGGYEARMANSFVEVLDSPMQDPDVIVLCDLAMFAYPAQKAQVLRAPAEMSPAALIAEVHRRVALRATLHATIAQAA